jgi:hypothetical protein
MKRQLIAFALATAVAAPSAFAITDAQLKAVKKSLNSVPVPELPAKAAELVSQASREDREAVAVTVVRAAIHKSRPSAPAVVAAVSKASPDVAEPASRVAAELEAGQSESISTAASGAAPSARGAIASGIQQGVYGTSASASASSAPSFSSSFAPSAPSSSASTKSAFTFATSASPTASTAATAPTAAAAPFAIHGSAKTEHGSHVEIHDTPINEDHGGDGHGRFPTHPPFVVPPGHDPDHHGRPDFVDYTKPRHF